MKSLLELYGQQFRNPMPNSDSQDYTTADVFGQMGANKRRSEYDNSLLGMVHNWASGEARQPVQLPDNAPLMDQMKEAGMRMLNLPNDMAAGGAKTMAHWMGASAYPERVETIDMMAPLGIGAMAAPFMPRGAVGSAGGRLAAGSSENAPRIGVQSVMASAIPGYQNMGQLQRGMIADIYEHAKIGEMPSETAMRIGQRDGVDFAPLDRELGWLDAEVAKIRQADGEPRVVDGFRGGKVSADQPVMFGTDAIELARLFGDVEPVQARFKNALEVDADGKSWRHVPFEAGVHTSDDIANLARERGHDGVVFKNMFESPDYNKTSDTYPNVFTALQRGTVFDNDGNLLFADQSRSSLPGLAANALDMSHEARMQRAREMGFDTDTTWFHGTNAKDFDAFDPGSRGATFFSDQPYLTDLFANPSRSDGTSRVVPAYTKANKLFDPSREADNPDLASYISENIRRYDVESILDPGKTWAKTPEEVLSELRGSKFDKDMFEPVEHPVIQEWMKRNGYDGFVVDDGSWMANAADKPARVMGVFDPKNLRSTNAAFDPSKADSANLLAADQARGSLPGLLAGAADEPRGITAYHGSPHDFDRFSMDKIGTGEGAQAYGSGLYFAENEAVAKSYRNAGTKNMDGRASADAYIDALRKWTADGRKGDMPTPESVAQGRLYEVRINADPEDFLDWDKPLSQQSEKVRAIVGQAVAVDNVDVRQVPGGWQVFVNDKPASVPYGRKQDADARVAGGVRTSNVTNATNNVSDIARDPALVEQLREAGIPGVRYLDQGSRTAGEGSRNYVVFDDALVEILRKYGLLGMIGGGSLLGSSESEASPAGGLFGVP